MKEMIARCGLDCEACEARIATANNDDALREAVAKKWAAMFDSPEITAAAINCTGCRTDGVKFGHCSMCEIRKCASDRGFDTCGECASLDSCESVAHVLEHAPEARVNLGR